MSEGEVKAWFEENNPDNTIDVDLYYIAMEKGLLHKTVKSHS
jgi:hypothetical protein